MIPNILVQLKKLPTTINGKIDRKSLIDIDIPINLHYYPPRNNLDLDIRSIYADLLGLPLAKISINADFFALGGNSIIAIRLVNKLNNILKLQVEIGDVLLYRTIKLLSDNLSNKISKLITIPIYNNLPETGYLLSFAQDRLAFVDEYEGGSNAYNISLTYKINEWIDLNILERSLYDVVRRHQVLYSKIGINGNGENYVKLYNETIILEAFIYSQINTIEELELLIGDDVNYVFDLYNEIPIKINIYENIHKNWKYISIVIHHIAFDGWSEDIFLKEIQEFYLFNSNKAHGQNKKQMSTLVELDIQYRDYSLWQRKNWHDGLYDKHLSYWVNKLKGYKALILPLDQNGPEKYCYSGNNIHFKLDAKYFNKLKSLSKTYKISIFSLLLSAYFIFLHKITNQTDIIIGTPVTNRHHVQIENMIGYFINTLLLRSIINTKASVENYIQAVSNDVIESQLYQEIPLEKIVEALKVKRDMSKNPLFQTRFGVQSFGKSKNPLFEVYDSSNSYRIARFDLTVMIDNSGEDLLGHFNYATSLFNESTVHRWISIYLNILKQYSKLDKNTSISDLISSD